MIVLNSTEYNTIHQHNLRWWTKNSICEHCKEEKRTEWSNKSGLYNTEREDWQELCKKCHVKYDRDILGTKWGRPKKIQNPS